MKKTPDFILIIVTLLLLTIGMIMVYSASAVWASYKMGDSFFFAKRQLLFAGLGVVAMFFYYESRLLGVAKLFQGHFTCLFYSSYSCPHSWSRTCSRRSAELDWYRSVFHSTFRVYEVCDDYFLSQIFG